jgi:hypothetical protein
MDCRRCGEDWDAMVFEPVEELICPWCGHRERLSFYVRRFVAEQLEKAHKSRWEKGLTIVDLDADTMVF